MIIPIILSGGSGTRLWPLSRKHYPKQFLNLVGESTLFQDTIKRLPKDTSDPLIVCNEEHRFIVAEQLRQIDSGNKGIILESIGKNTAPAITIAAMKTLELNSDPVLLVLSADHLIKNDKKFHSAISSAKTIAEQGKIVALGVKPTKGHTGYGYIEVNKQEYNESYNIISFIEKPNVEIAQKYFDSGNFYWNSGIFMFRASIFLEELKKFAPEIYSVCKKTCHSTHNDLDFIRINSQEFSKCPDISVDYAVMEKTKIGVVVPFEEDWHDVGSWEALWNAKPKDKNKNVLEGDVILNKVDNSFIYSSNRLVTVHEVSNLIIADTQDALLIANKKSSHEIGAIVEKINISFRNESVNHRKVYRPWGYFDSIDSGEGFKVKRIFVNPASKLSLQKHQYRSEHWVVVKGNAKITCGKKKFKLKENQSTFIPKGTVHRLENEENTILEIIEIQTGEYLGEDDIIRIEDDYQRH
jgi:mannose-1-phosphate guanylyltransferase